MGRFQLFIGWALLFVCLIIVIGNLSKPCSDLENAGSNNISIPDSGKTMSLLEFKLITTGIYNTIFILTISVYTAIFALVGIIIGVKSYKKFQFMLEDRLSPFLPKTKMLIQGYMIMVAGTVMTLCGIDIFNNEISTLVTLPDICVLSIFWGFIAISLILIFYLLKKP